MSIRNIYLKIEEIAEYSPVEPSPHAAANYRRDCMRNPGHEDGRIPLSEVQARTLVALIYREYLDPGYTVPKPDKLIQADINEPIFPHLVPGTVVYARPGDHLHIQVLNGDVMPHSFHVHGLGYGIESDGSWPLGTQATDGRRSDEICPGQSWVYHFDVTEEMVGAWPFHEHYRMIGDNVNRGLFGGIVVLPAEDCDAPKPFQLPPLVEDFFKRRLLAAGDPAAHDLAGGHTRGAPMTGGHAHGAGGPISWIQRPTPRNCSSRNGLSLPMRTRRSRTTTHCTSRFSYTRWCQRGESRPSIAVHSRLGRRHSKRCWVLQAPIRTIVKSTHRCKGRLSSLRAKARKQWSISAISIP